MVHCVAYGCTQRSGCKESIRFHTFPHRDEVLLKKWVVAIRRESFIPSKHSRVCSKHFLQSDYYPGGSRELLKTSVPSVFNFPERLQKTKILEEHW